MHQLIRHYPNLDNCLKVKNLIPGTYIINAYESIQSSYGDTYKIYVTNASNERVVFWSNSFLSSYINKILDLDMRLKSLLTLMVGLQLLVTPELQN